MVWLELANNFPGVLHGYIGFVDGKEFEIEKPTSMDGEEDLEQKQIAIKWYGAILWATLVGIFSSGFL